MEFLIKRMKYFTKELWLGYNSRNDAERQRAFVKGEDNAQEYKRQLEDLRPRLTREAYDFFTTESLHDGRLLAFTAGDAIDYGIQGHAGRFDINIHSPAVEIELLGANLDVQYTLKYGSVRKVVFDYPTDVPLFHHEGGHIGDWGYDEVTAADENYLRHEVLFRRARQFSLNSRSSLLSDKLAKGLGIFDAFNIRVPTGSGILLSKSLPFLTQLPHWECRLRH